MHAFTTIACVTCINQSSGTDVVAANGAVFVMMGALGLVFLSIFGVLLAFMRRARRLSAATGTEI